MWMSPGSQRGLHEMEGCPGAGATRIIKMENLPQEFVDDRRIVPTDEPKMRTRKS